MRFQKFWVGQFSEHFNFRQAFEPSLSTFFTWDEMGQPAPKITTKFN
jgi:hypothetical protein